MRQPDDWAEHEISEIMLVEENTKLREDKRILQEWLEGHLQELAYTGSDNYGEVSKLLKSVKD